MPQLEFQHFLPQLVWLAITFTVLYLIMARVALPRIGSVLAARRERVESDLEAADKANREAQQALEEYEAAIAKARSEAQSIVAEAHDEAQAEASERQHALEEELVGEMAEATRSIGEAREEAMKNLSGIAAEAAQDATQKLIGVEASEAEVKQALEGAKGGS